MNIFQLLHSLLKETFLFLANYRRINRCYRSQHLAADLAAKPASERQIPIKILLLTPYSPLPAYTGAAIRRIEQIHFLGSRYSLAVVSFISSDLEYDLPEKLQKFCFLTIPIKRRQLRMPGTGKGISNKPDSINRFASWRMKVLLRKLNSLNFDIVLLDTIFMAQYASIFPNSYQILLEQNIESAILAGILDLSRKLANSSGASCDESELRSFQNYENQTWAHFPLRAVVSEVDRQELDSRCSVGKTIVVKNGVDLQKITSIDSSPDSKKILFMGTMSYIPNIDAVRYFIEDILPIVWRSSAEFKFCIAGSSPVPEVYNLVNDARIEIIANPEDIDRIAKDCSLTVVPLRLGSGTRLKILQAMAMGLPVVSTPLGAEGLDVVNNVHISICDRPEQFAAAVICLTSDLSFRSSLQFNARTLVEECYSWENIFREFEQDMLSEFSKSRSRPITG